LTRARRTDGNHAAIIRGALDVGAAVLDIHALAGTLDILIGFRSVLYLIEIKDPARPKSARALTAAETATIDRFRLAGCPVHVIETVEQLWRVIGAID